MRLKLDDIEVKSFVTSMKQDEQRNVVGGLTLHGPACSNNVCDPINTNDTCPDGQADPSAWPCDSVHVNCQLGTASPCSSIGTWCSCPPACQA